MNKLDKFEEMMRNSLDDHEVEYDPSQWNSLNKKLGKSKGTGNTTWLAVAGVAFVLVTAVLVYNYNTTSENTDLSKTNDLNNTITNNENNNAEKIGDINKSELVTENNEVSINETETNNSVDIKAVADPKIKADPIDNKTPNPTLISDPKILLNPGGLTYTVDAPLAKLPKPLITTSSTEICAGKKVELLAKNIPENATCVWMVNAEKIETKTGKLEYTFANSGTQTISLSYAKGKQTSEIVEQEVFVKALSIIDFTFDKEVIDGKPVVNFKADGDASDFMFSFEDGTTAPQNATKFFRHKGLYIVKLNAEGNNGCPVEIKKGVEIEEEYNLFAPTTFTPNGDGRNDMFIPVALTVMDVEFTMSIFTRDGRLVYQTNSANRPWDGKFTSDNQTAPFGAYVWIVNIKGEEPYKGSITLMP